MPRTFESGFISGDTSRHNILSLKTSSHASRGFSAVRFQQKPLEVVKPYFNLVNIHTTIPCIKRKSIMSIIHYLRIQSNVLIYNFKIVTRNRTLFELKCFFQVQTFQDCGFARQLERWYVDSLCRISRVLTPFLYVFH